MDKSFFFFFNSGFFFGTGTVAGGVVAAGTESDVASKMISSLTIGSISSMTGFMSFSTWDWMGLSCVVAMGAFGVAFFKFNGVRVVVFVGFPPHVAPPPTPSMDEVTFIGFI